MRRCLKIHVFGKVQGVSYRHVIQKHAQKLEIEGTIHNMDDGSVLINACGSSEKLDDLIDYVYKGSSASKIEDVVIEPLIQDKDFRGVFRVIGAN